MMRPFHISPSYQSELSDCSFFPPTHSSAPLGPARLHHPHTGHHLQPPEHGHTGHHLQPPELQTTGFMNQGEGYNPSRLYHSSSHHPPGHYYSPTEESVTQKLNLYNGCLI